MKNFFLLLLCLTCATLTSAQTLEELKTQKAEKQAEANKIQAEADAIQAQIDAMPGWRFGAFGTIGANISGFNNWFAKGTPNNNSGNIGVTVNAYANLIQETYFWRNSANINLAWLKNDDRDTDTDSDSFDPANDVFNVTSLYGHRLSETFAISTLGEYRTTLLDNFNDPGYLDLGLGGTWTPTENLVVVVHPLNYNFVFADNKAVFDSSLGAKIVADYTKAFGKLNFKSNLSAFQSYKSSDLSNWTWINSLGYTLWKGIGLGFEFGLRNNKQEALNYALAQFDPMGGNPTPTFGNVDNDLQSYWLFGLNYAF